MFVSASELELAEIEPRAKHLCNEGSLVIEELLRKPVNSVETLPAAEVELEEKFLKSKKAERF